MALGWLLPVDETGYLLLGVPLTVLFQLGVRRRPLTALWVRDPPRSRLGRRGAVVAAVLAVAPGVFLVERVAAGDWAGTAWMTAALGGAVAAGYSLQQAAAARTARAAVPATVVGTAVMGLVLGIGLVRQGYLAAPVLDGLTTAALSLALYLPVAFVLEEVTFRGLLDSHVHHVGEPRGVASALLVSASWGLWHLPVTDADVPLAAQGVGLVVVHCLIGVPLSLAWRRSGNLAAPAAAHAVVDAVRNGLQAVV